MTFWYGVAIVRSDKYLVVMNNPLAAGATKTTDTEVAARITARLDDLDITKTDLAEQVGLSYTTLRRRLEQHRNDANSLTLRELVKIAEVLEVQPSALLPKHFTGSAA